MPKIVINVMELASLFNASVNPRVMSYTIAIVVIGFSILSSFKLKPNATVKTLNKTVKKAYICYQKHKAILDKDKSAIFESATFEDKVKRIWVEAFKLKERHLQVHNDIMSCYWTDCRSWRRYIWETMAIWVKARQHQHEIAELRKTLKRAILRAHRGKLEGDAVHHREEITGGEELALKFCRHLKSS
ncbi:hypothetical protein IW261DRAFT_1565732 [Armillaria novae-zelandiae]|uniref:Uncharacterized protein n=1 Tax=Armillaria novae-zelandiae TaxID=153914 RepID=A0AA39P6A8_9AGAR|nr:hypothetical protein IW261DRAFT_1565732 [Armillaria novae-zelandiae]